MTDTKHDWMRVLLCPVIASHERYIIFVLVDNWKKIFFWKKKKHINPIIYPSISQSVSQQTSQSIDHFNDQQMMQTFCSNIFIFP